MNYKECTPELKLTEGPVNSLCFKSVFEEIKTVAFLLLVTFLICIMPQMSDLQPGTFKDSAVQIAIAKTFQPY